MSKAQPHVKEKGGVKPRPSPPITTQRNRRRNPLSDHPNSLASLFVSDTEWDKMQNTVAKVAVAGSGISGAVCAATLARNGISVTLFDSARGPGGRMSQRREISEDGKELLFDHGAPYFTVTNPDVLSVVAEWESRGLVAEWKSNFGSFDCSTNKFVNTEPSS
ncbi:hypothetical protein F3Y22_tig00110372pilonHSYRG00112 [Hibiscus syriacus]|uniref:Uncharacterized protein n=1 Tax=Hibiscus syriacus TaxID=106335 RepID=A0A6A3AU53_HIBSY|nr:hypothetical protein F3Y22_tig00110372pilonHSYRG00112 [Hibiscus syriacus]